jgi:CHRD domain
MRMRHITIGTLAALGLVLGLTALAGAQGAGNRAIFAVLTGAKEVDAVTGDRGAGDLNGRGSFSATFDGNELCYGIQVKNIDDPIAAHIHRGGRNVAGPVVMPLEHPEAGDPGSSTACEDVPAALARQIKRTPRRFYVNVHTADFPGGAVRGQLFARAR